MTDDMYTREVKLRYAVSVKANYNQAQRPMTLSWSFMDTSTHVGAQMGGNQPKKGFGWKIKPLQTV